MRKDLLHILQHSLGLDQYGPGRHIRNAAARREIERRRLEKEAKE